MKKVFLYSGYGLTILFFIAAIFAFVAPRFGWRVDVVLSGSMEPQLKMGSLVISRPVDAEDIKLNDTITFYSPLTKQMTTHRVIAVNTSPSWYFRTKGDASEDADPFNVPAENVAGKVYFDIPYLGYVIHFIKTPPGFLLTFCLSGLITIAIEVRNIWKIIIQDRTERKYRIG